MGDCAAPRSDRSGSLRRGRGDVWEDRGPGVIVTNRTPRTRGGLMFRYATPIVAALAMAMAAAIQDKPQTPPAGQTFTLSGNLVRGYQNVQRNLLEAAEKMPEASYS